MPDDTVEANLTPIMSILVILIPMLLALFNFFEVTVQAVAAPRNAPGGQQQASPPRAVLHVGEAALNVHVVGGQTQLEPVRIPHQDTGPNYARLNVVLTELAAAHPRMSRTLMVNAGEEIPWQVVASAVDAARHELVNPRAYATSAPRVREVAGPDGTTRAEPVSLFPRVIFGVEQ